MHESPRSVCNLCWALVVLLGGATGCPADKPVVVKRRPPPRDLPRGTGPDDPVTWLAKLRAARTAKDRKVALFNLYRIYELRQEAAKRDPRRRAAVRVRAVGRGRAVRRPA